MEEKKKRKSDDQQYVSRVGRTLKFTDRVGEESESYTKRFATEEAAVDMMRRIRELVRGAASVG